MGISLWARTRKWLSGGREGLPGLTDWQTDRLTAHSSQALRAAGRISVLSLGDSGRGLGLLQTYLKREGPAMSKVLCKISDDYNLYIPLLYMMKMSTR